MAYIAKCHLESVSAYSQSRPLGDEFGLRPNESHDDREARIWAERAQFDEEGWVVIPPLAIVNSIKEAAKYLSMKIQGEGNAKYTKHFAAGIMANEPVRTQTRKEDLIKETFFVPANGRRGDGTRVYRSFPMVPHWEAVVTIYILDDKITKEVFSRALVAAGTLIGIGRFRPINQGYYGRFKCNKLEWDFYEIGA